jgi:hypothetical protein
MKNDRPTPLEPSRLAEVLTTFGISWMQDPRGYLVVPFRLGDDDKLILTYAVDDDKILVIRGVSSAMIDPDEFPLVIGLLNAWHDGYRWPTASLDVTEPEARVVASFEVLFGAGVTEAQLAGFVAVGTHTIGQFHRWLDEQHRSVRARTEETVSVVELEEWFRRAA